jgi:hypothetical protein
MAAVEIPMGGDALARSVRRIPRVAIVGVGLVGSLMYRRRTRVGRSLFRESFERKQ